jgi:hypothetical protein
LSKIKKRQLARNYGRKIDRKMEFRRDASQIHCNKRIIGEIARGATKKQR